MISKLMIKKKWHKKANEVCNICIIKDNRSKENHNWQTSDEGCCNSGGISGPWFSLLLHAVITWVGWIENSEPDIWRFDLAFFSLFLYFLNLTQYLPATSKEHQIVISAVRKITQLHITNPKNKGKGFCEKNIMDVF